jgi:hypothetical protein
MKLFFLLFINFLYAIPNKWKFFHEIKREVNEVLPNGTLRGCTEYSLRKFYKISNQFYNPQNPLNFIKMISYFSSEESGNRRFNIINLTLFWILFKNQDVIDFKKLVSFANLELIPEEMRSIILEVSKKRFRNPLINVFLDQSEMIADMDYLFILSDDWHLFHETKRSIKGSPEKHTENSLLDFYNISNQLYNQNPFDFIKMISYFASEESGKQRFTNLDLTIFWMLFRNQDEIDYKILASFANSELPPIKMRSIILNVLNNRFRNPSVNVFLGQTQMTEMIADMDYILSSSQDWLLFHEKKRAVNEILPTGLYRICTMDSLLEFKETIDYLHSKNPFDFARMVSYFSEVKREIYRFTNINLLLFLILFKSQNIEFTEYEALVEIANNTRHPLVMLAIIKDTKNNEFFNSQIDPFLVDEKKAKDRKYQLMIKSMKNKIL